MVIAPAENNRPYAPPSNLISILHRLRSRNLPERIDIEYMRDAGVPEGTVGRALFGLRFLGLITETGEPAQPLRSIHTSTDEEYKTILAGLVREAYHDVFSVGDPAEDTQERLLNMFRRYTPASQRMRMVIFFLGMCREADIPTLDAPRQRSMGGSLVRPAARTQARRAPATSRPQGQNSRNRGGTPGSSGLEVAPALEGLMRSLPDPGTSMSPEKRAQWIRMAEATLEFLYPDAGEEEIEEEGEAQAEISAPREAGSAALFK